MGKYLDWGYDVYYYMVIKFWKLNRIFLFKNEGCKLENYRKDYRKIFFFRWLFLFMYVWVYI